MSDYDSDLILWTERQAELLRRMGTGERVNDQVDWHNVAEEIESLGRRDKRELENRIATILVHLMKLQCSPASEPRELWRQTVAEQRRRVKRLLRDSPSLRSSVAQVVADELEEARVEAALAMQQFGEARTALPNMTYTPEQVLGSWLPGE